MILAALLLPLIATPQENGSALISKMINYYHKATSVSGTIAMKQNYALGSRQFDEKVEALTTLHFDRVTRKTYLNQQFATKKESSRILLTADGDNFSYNQPLSVMNPDPNKRAVEGMSLNGKPLTEKDVYHVVSGMLRDRSPALDIAFADKQDLSGIRSSIFDIRKTRQERLRDQDVNVVLGGWTDIIGAKAATGLYEFWIGSEGELLRFVQTQNIYVTKNPNDAPVNVTVIWDVNLKINVQLDAKLFKVIL